MKKLLLIAALAATSLSAFAGTYSLVSMTELLYSPIYTAGTFIPARSISGHTLNADISLEQITSGGNIDCEGKLVWDVTVQILWTPDYVGEPAPSARDLVWDFDAEGRGGLTSGGFTDSVYTQGTFIPDLFSPSAFFSGTPTTYNLASTGGHRTVTQTWGGVTFANVGGQWIGTGVVEIQLDLYAHNGIVGYMTYEGRMAYSMILKRVLTGETIN